jgi:DNA ligase 1
LKRFVQLYQELDSTSGTNDKLDALVRYFQQSTDEDKVWCIALLTGKRPARPVKTSLMKIWAAELAGIPEWLFDESYYVTGDLGEVLSLLITGKGSSDSKPLHIWMKELEEIRKKTDEEKKIYVTNAWRDLNQSERFVFNKLIGGSFRIGISSGSIVNALSKYCLQEPSAIQFALSGKWNPATTSFKDLMEGKDNEISKPYPFFLANGIDFPVEDLGPVEDWIVEKKWDGIRGQIIKRKGEIFVWSRGEELITDSFPEFKLFSAHLTDGVVLDGEIICHNENHPLPFQLLQSRINRKNVSKSLLKSAPVSFLAYDILESGGEDIRSYPLSERKKILEDLVKNAGHPGLLYSEILLLKDWNGAAEIRAESRKLYCEGLMLKSASSSYQSGRKRGDWWKWKVDPFTIDAVMIYAMQGHGKRANLFTDYTFAVWDNEKLVPFTKAYSGLNNDEIAEVDAFVKKNTIEKFGPVRSVTAELVFEIAFEGIQLSPRHKSGIALRFPRIHRWRKDKLHTEANTIADLRNLLEQYGK